MDTQKSIGFPEEGLRVYLLSAPRVEWAGQPLAIPRRQVRALLYRLATRPEPVLREQLCFLFWPDIPDATARRNLIRLLSYLRYALPAPDMLVTAGDQIRLDPRRAWSDAAAFERLCATPREEPRFLEALQQAVDLYRGPFLAGFSLTGSPEFEAWVALEQQTLERQYLEALAVLIEEYTGRREHDTAIACARRFLATDDLAEDVHRRLIRLYAEAGDRGAALRQYEQCAIVLERELGVKPLPETQAAYRAVLEDMPPPVVAPAIEPAWTTLPGLHVPLVGRDAELRRLEQAYARARSGQGGVVLIWGEAGIGKSRLMQDFATHLAGQALVLTGAGSPDVQTMPYQPIVEALRPALGQGEGERGREGEGETRGHGDFSLSPPHPLTPSPVWLAEASRLLPELRDLHSDLPPPMEAEPEEARSRLFEALCQIVLGLAASPWLPGSLAPLLLCLDDLHWADGATLDWLTYLGRQLRDSRLLVIGTYRSEEAAAVSALRRSLTRLSVLSDLPLRALDEVAVLQLLRHLVGRVPGDEAVARRLQQATGGNPFFLMETLRALVETGRPLEDPATLEALPLPDTVRETVERRLGRLSPKARQVLEAGAVLGPGFGFDLVRQTAGRGEVETLDGLDELVGRHLLLEQAAGYRFNHEVIRMAAYQGLSFGRRQRLHRRAGETLEQRQRDQAAAALTWPVERPDESRAAELTAIVATAERLAYHFERAGIAEKAACYLLEAGDRARGLYAHQEAIGFYQRALELLEEQGEYERAARTLMKLGLTYHSAFDFRRARQAYDEGFALWQRAGQMQPAGPPPPAPHALRVEQPDPTTLDPTLAVDIWSATVIEQLFSGLVERSPEMEVVPNVARRWEVSAGGRQYVFHLREDVVWSDGAPVTAGDFEHAWKRALDPATGAPMASLLYDVKGAKAFHQGEMSDPDRVGVRALDEVTLVVELEGPTGYFPHLLAHHVTYPVPRHMVEAHGEMWTDMAPISVGSTEVGIVTNGPFRLEAWQPGQSMVLARNPEYHGRFTGNVQRVELALLSEWSAALELYEADELDVLNLLGTGPEVDRVRQQHAGEYVSGPMLETRYLGFDVRRPPFDDVRVRRAFVHAVDREELADVVLRGYAPPATGGLVPPGMPGHAAEIGLSYDPELARQLLAEAGYGGGRGFPTVDALTGRIRVPESEYLRAQWRKNLGVEITWQVAEPGMFYDRLEKTPPHMHMLAWMADYPDPDNFLRASTVRLDTRWRNEAYDRLVEEARRATDQGERIQLYQAADRLLIEAAAIMPLSYARFSLLVKPWVRKFPTSANSLRFWKEVIIEPH